MACRATLQGLHLVSFCNDDSPVWGGFRSNDRQLYGKSTPTGDCGMVPDAKGEEEDCNFMDQQLKWRCRKQEESKPHTRAKQAGS